MYITTTSLRHIDVINIDLGPKDIITSGLGHISVDASGLGRISVGTTGFDHIIITTIDLDHAGVAVTGQEQINATMNTGLGYNDIRNIVSQHINATTAGLVQKAISLVTWNNYISS